MSIFEGWTPSGPKHLSADERLNRLIRDGAWEALRDTLAEHTAQISELRGMMARHKIVDQRKPEKQECVRHGPAGFVPFTETIKDRRGRKT